ncbi:related to PMR1-Ca++-transporting P-type ATPase located in Golgi [Rhynchosporium secalis]|uniref:Magnesium-transporting ATPase, P-type 1 n=1 Tax=Rhynchosporium secalis TaxID=38038 RepID=A0A1E1M9N9_RHYSE|nr:related to PMR1-Ca++-transporting P-type ATPase located in Golgi [Rhynchosporium secalis]
MTEDGDLDNGLYDEKSATEETTPEAKFRAFASQLDICGALRSRTEGLTHAEAAQRLLQYGDNKQVDVEYVTWKRIAYDSVFNYYNLMLMILAIITVVMPDREWSLFATKSLSRVDPDLMIVVPVSAGISFCQDLRSNNRRTSASESLPHYHVRRQTLDGNSTQEEVEVKNIVCGDVLSLSAGDVVPADCIVLDSSNLSVSQSSLTGEGEPQVKAFGLGDEKEGKTTVFDLQNFVFSTTSVISGSGLVIVVATGNGAFISSIMKKLNGRRPKNIFQKGIDRTCQFLVAFMVISFAIILVVKGTKSGRWKQAVVFSLSTAATLVPEMLPAVVTANLSRGAFLLRKIGVIVNHMDAIHSLGSMSILCSDKTGTLTKDEIEICHSLNPIGGNSGEVFLLASTNAYSQRGTKNAIDSAIIKHTGGEEKLVELGRRVGEIPFNFEARRSSCVIRTPTGGLKLICKGAFEEVVARCSHIRVGTKIHNLSGSQYLGLTSRIEHFNAEAYRVVLVATRDISHVDFDGVGSDFNGLDIEMTVEGFLTFLDPLQPDAKESVTRLQELGIDVRILTGDNLGVAMSVARNLGLAQDLDEGTPLAISGPKLASLQDPEEWKQSVRKCKIFAKLTPAQKGRVVETLQAHGKVVGMIGDGINDSVALRAVDVGISVDSGSSVAKNSADLILTEKQLAKIVDAVKIGRKTHGNVMKYMKMILAANFGNILSVVIAAVWFPFDPISPVQMVLQNLLYDLSQLAIPFDNVDDEYLAFPHKFSILNLMVFILLMGPVISTIDIGTFLLNVFYYGFAPSSDILQVENFQSHWFISGMLSQTLVIYIFRTAKVPFIQSCPSIAILLSTLIASVLGLAVPYIPPFAKALKLVPSGGTFIGIILACLVLFAVVLQLAKMLYIKIWKRWL